MDDRPRLVLAPVLITLFSCFLASEVGLDAFFFAHTLCLIMGFFAFPLVAFGTLLISLHATLRCLNVHVS